MTPHAGGVRFGEQWDFRRWNGGQRGGRWGGRWDGRWDGRPVLRSAAAAVLGLVLLGGPVRGGAPTVVSLADPAVGGRQSAAAAVDADPPPDQLPPAEVPAPGGSPPPEPLPGGATGAGRYGWPLRPAPAIVTPFAQPDNPYGPGHRGVDLAGAPGGPVTAARAGTVAFAGPVAGRGVVSVQHDDGLRTTYEPVAPTVAAGAVVHAGDVIGTLEPGHPGCPVPACLHWGARRDRTEYVDPLALLGPARVRLLPVPDPWPDRSEPA